MLKKIIKHILIFILPKKLQDALKKIRTRILVNRKKRQMINLVSTLKPLEDKDSPRYIVSLTSYGKRIVDSAPYAIVTLLNQVVKPNKIVLWVAYEEKKNIPSIMNRLVEKGVEIRFCEDIKSYKKLIFALQEFPEDYIITADDDLYYPKNWFEQLIVEHKKNPKKIICHRASKIKVDEYHNPLPYIKWVSYIEPNSYFADALVLQGQCILKQGFERGVFPTCGAGALYPPHCLYKEITNKKLFTKLSPYADDIWFWAMAVINKEYFGNESPFVVIPNGYSQNLHYIDPEDQNNNALWNYNISDNGNDRQLKAIIDYFPKIRDVLEKIESFCYGILQPCGFVMKLDTNDWIQKPIYEKGCYEKTDVLALLSLMPQDGVFFDIGVNVGVYSLNLCKKAKYVYSFEATEKTYKQLLETISMNNIKNIHHNFSAVHNESGIEIEIWQGSEVLGKDNAGSNGLFNKGEGGIIANVVKSITIDDFVNNNNIEKIDIIKIDIEGNELNALKGARESILRFRPIILCEINPEINEKAGYKSKELLAFFVNTLSYFPTFFLGNKFLPASEKKVIKSQCNVFFFPKEKKLNF